MNDKTMTDFEVLLTTLFGDYLNLLQTPGVDTAPDEAYPISATTDELIADPKAIAHSMFQEALKNGITPSNLEIEQQKLGGGNTALSVTQVSGVLSFVLKIDMVPKLVEEAKVLRRLRDGENSLPDTFRNRFPRIYAIKDDAAPYAYLMENFSPKDGYIGLDNLLFREDGTLPDDTDIDILDATMEALFEGYAASRNTRLQPNINEDYILRIAERMIVAAEHDGIFAPQTVVLNGDRYPSWQEMLNRIDSAAVTLEAMRTPFSTVVHGDSHPGNVMIRNGDEGCDIRFIDPKIWEHGDYLFDVAKMAHYLDATGPIELLDQASKLNQAKVDNNQTVIDYEIARPAWILKARRSIEERTEAFADRYGDPHWRQRYDLGMASNLLGLPAGRLDSERRAAAIMLYAEGLKWLRKFTDTLPGS